MTSWTLLEGDCRVRLRELPAESVHCVVTSPPYWGLRDYGITPNVWGGDPACEHEWGGDPACEHEWGGGLRVVQQTGGRSEKQLTHTGNDGTGFVSSSSSCIRCGAWRGVLGLEPTPALYLEHMAEIMREVWRVLRKDGTLWLNLGDCYATGAGKVGDCPGGGEQGERWKGMGPSSKSTLRGNGHVGGGPKAHAIPQVPDTKNPAGIPTYQPNRMPLKPKDLVGIPWLVAFALQADGWWLRSDIVWWKPNPMPESVTDRPTKSHEYVFLLTKSERYFYDAEAVREPHSSIPPGKSNDPEAWRMSPATPREGRPDVLDSRGVASRPPNYYGGAGGRNLRSVWRMTTQPYADAHFATFPAKLPARCIRAGTSQHGVCGHCGAPWERIVERNNPSKYAYDGDARGFPFYRRTANPQSSASLHRQKGGVYSSTSEMGWKASCSCGAEIVPATVLDPFSGAGTTGLAALGLGRSYIGCDLNPAYNAMARERLGGHLPLFATEKPDPPAVETLPLFGPVEESSATD